MLTREQVRMARAALGWTAQDLADKTGLAVNTVRRIENGADAMGDTLGKIEAAIKDAGMLLIEAGDYQGQGGAGLRFKS